MEWVLIGTVGLAFVVAICCGALVEVFRQLADVRAALNLDDQPRPVNVLHAGIPARQFGLPEQLDALPEAIVIFLSATCGTCFAIAEAFRGGAPDSVWFVVSAERNHRILHPLSALGDRVIVDPGAEIAGRLSLEILPMVLSLRFGAILRAHAVSSPRQVLNLVPATLSAAVGLGSLDRGVNGNSPQLDESRTTSA